MAHLGSIRTPRMSEIWTVNTEDCELYVIVMKLEISVSLSFWTVAVNTRFADHEELAAAEAFNREMAELEDLEHQQELRLLLQDRINGEMVVVLLRKISTARCSLNNLRCLFSSCKALISCVDRLSRVASLKTSDCAG